MTTTNDAPAPAPSGVIIHAIASLAAAISLLERTPKAKKAAPSDRMFEQMLCDYRKALDEARAVLTSAPTHANAETIAELHERIRNLMQTLEESAAAEGRWQHQAQSFQRLYEECQVAMENAGYLGSVPNCIKELCARAERATLASGATPAATSGSEDGGDHPDDLAVDRFAAAMKTKLAKKRAEGRGGWEDKEDCSNAFLSQLLREHIDKGDPVDVGNLAMMIHQRGERIG